MVCTTNVARSGWTAVTGKGDKDATNAVPFAALFRQISNNLAWAPTYTQDEGHNGTPWYDASGVALDTEGLSGTWLSEPRADDFRSILPLLIGGTFAGDVLEPDVAGYCDYFRIGRGLGIVQQDFLNTMTTNWTLSSSSSQTRLRLEWGMLALSQTRTGDGSVPAGPTFSNVAGFYHTSSNVTVDGVVHPMDDIQITGTNNLNEDRFNTTSPTDLYAGRQVFSFTGTTAFDDAADIAWFDLGVTHVTAQFVYTAPGLSLTIDFPAVQPIVPTPNSPAGEARMKHEGIVWTARAPVTGTAPITFTLDDTP